MHYSFEATQDKIIELDIQGVGHALCDPEIASIVLLEDEGEVRVLCRESFYSCH